MARAYRYKSEAKAAIHETMEALYEGGTIDKQTMRRFDESCLIPVHPLTPEEIRAIREKERVSQSVFSHYLNVTAGLISQWERGEKKPSGPSLKLLLIVSKKGLSAIA
jgi:putative transcriptional regulator